MTSQIFSTKDLMEIVEYLSGLKDPEVRRVLVEQFVDIISKDSANFSPDKFRKACGVV